MIRTRDWLSAPRMEQTGEAVLSCLLPHGNSAIVRHVEPDCGMREILLPAQVATRAFVERNGSVCMDAGYAAPRGGSQSAAVAGSDDALRRLATVRQSSVSQLRLS